MEIFGLGEHEMEDKTRKEGLAATLICTLVILRTTEIIPMDSAGLLDWAAYSMEGE